LPLWITLPLLVIIAVVIADAIALWSSHYIAIAIAVTADQLICSLCLRCVFL
jgi:hypothetical protein